MSQRVPTNAQVDAYAQSFIEHGDMSRAFRAAFPKSKAKPECINELGHKFHKLLEVRLRIAELQGKAKEIADEVFTITAEQSLKMGAAIYKAGMAMKKDALGNNIPVNLSAASSAHSEINKMCGLHAPTKTEDVTAKKPISSKLVESVTKLILDES